MIWYAVAFGAGLLVGWNFLQQPEFIKDFMSKILGNK